MITVKDLREELAYEVDASDWDGREERHRILEYLTDKEIIELYKENHVEEDFRYD